MSMQLIETVTLTSAASSIEFTSIPQDGVDLLLKVSVRNDTTWGSLRFRLAGDTASNYTTIYLTGNGSSVVSNSSTQPFAFLNDGTNKSDTTSNTFATSGIYFSNYASSVAKSISWDSVTENNATLAFQNLAAVRWNNTNAITSVEIFTGSNNFSIGSTASLYKIY